MLLLLFSSKVDFTREIQPMLSNSNDLISTECFYIIYNLKVVYFYIDDALLTDTRQIKIYERVYIKVRYVSVDTYVISIQ